MLERLRVGAGWGFCLLLMLSAGCSGRVLELSNTTAKNPTQPIQVKYLDVQNPSVTRAIEAADRAETTKLVRVEIVEVQNPKRYAATFRVEYQPKAGEKIFLGAFSLYPSDQPGTFTVATHGKVKSEGSIVVSLIIPENIRDSDILKVGVRKIQFVAPKDN
jgi:hypothetical protein